MRKSPGVAAKANGTRLNRGRALQVMCYPRKATKAVLVKAAKSEKRPLSNFMVMSSLERAAKLLGKPVKQLVPSEEYDVLYGTTA